MCGKTTQCAERIPAEVRFGLDGLYEASLDPAEANADDG